MSAVVGFDRPLYVMPFDHRASFEKGLFGVEGQPTPAVTAEIIRAKRIIYDAFLAALDLGVRRDAGCVLVDEQFGADILRDCAAGGYEFAASVEKSGQAEFTFEYGDRFAQHIEAFRPTFAKVLVRYNPGGDPERNRRQQERLQRLSAYLRAHSDSHFMFEMLVPPEKVQLERLGGDRAAYDRELRPGLMVEAIHALQDAGVEPDVWKVEGLDRREDCERIVTAARRDGRDHVGCIVLGRGADDRQVVAWLTVAARVPGFIGLAVGRTAFWGPLLDWRARAITRDEAVTRIASHYREFVGTFESAARGVSGR